MDQLTFAHNAARHAEALADEADDINRPGLAQRLRHLADGVHQVLAVHDEAAEKIEAARAARKAAHDRLQHEWKDASMRLDLALPVMHAACLDPGGVLDVAERVRWRIRRLSALEPRRPEVDMIRRRLKRALARYDDAIDGYLGACALAVATRERAVAESQVVRLKLEQAKQHLLARVPPKSDAHRRIKRRAVRTRRAQWVQDAADTLKNRVQLTLSESSHSETGPISLEL